MLYYLCACITHGIDAGTHENLVHHRLNDRFYYHGRAHGTLLGRFRQQVLVKPCEAGANGAAVAHAGATVDRSETEILFSPGALSRITEGE